EGQFAAGGPIATDRLAYRASGFFRRDAGYIDVVNEDTGATVRNNANSVDSYGGRFALAGRLSAAVNATLSLLYQKQESNDLSIYYTSRGIDVPIPLAPLQRTERSPVFRNERFALPNLTVKADLGAATLVSSSSYVDRRLDLSDDFSYFVQSA